MDTPRHSHLDFNRENMDQCHKAENWDQLIMSNPARFIELILPRIQMLAANFLRRRNKARIMLEAEDICQEICIHLMESDYRRLRLYDPRKASIETWLRSVVRNKIRENVRSAFVIATNSAIRCEYISKSPEDVFMKNERERLLNSAIKRLNKSDLAFLEVLKNSKFNIRELARITGINSSVAYVRKCRLVARIKKSLMPTANKMNCH